MIVVGLAYLVVGWGFQCAAGVCHRRRFPGGRLLLAWMNTERPMRSARQNW